MAGKPGSKEEVECCQRWAEKNVRSSMSRLAEEMYLRRLDKERTYEKGDGI